MGFDLSDVDDEWVKLAASERRDRPSHRKIEPTTDIPTSAIEEAYWIQYEGRVPIIGFGETGSGRPYAVTANDLLSQDRRRAG